MLQVVQEIHLQLVLLKEIQEEVLIQEELLTLIGAVEAAVEPALLVQTIHQEVKVVLE